MTPLQTKRQIDVALDAAKRYGFIVEIGNDIAIVAQREPYLIGSKIKVLPSFEAVGWFFAGYEMHQFERREIDRAACVPSTEKVAA